MVRAAQRWPSVREMENPAGWLWRTGFNVSRSFFRRLAAERRAHDRSARYPAVSAYDGDAVERLDVLETLRRLTPRQRMVLILHYLNDLSFAEVARILDMPESTAKSLAQRGLKRLRTDGQALRNEGVMPDA
jgi:RNA polymerase sigma-70 factor (ECF subfamily)